LTCICVSFRTRSNKWCAIEPKGEGLGGGVRSQGGAQGAKGASKTLSAADAGHCRHVIALRLIALLEASVSPPDRMRDAELAKRLNRTVLSVRIRRLPKTKVSFIQTPRRWTAAELRKLERLPDAEVARRTGRFLASARNKRVQLGISCYTPAQNRNVGGQKGEAELFRRCIRLIDGIRVWIK